MTDLARLVLDELRANPAALAELRALVAVEDVHKNIFNAPAYTVGTLAVELGRTPRSIRAAIARGELAAVKRGRGYVIGADAVATWAHSEARSVDRVPGPARPRRRRSGAGPMRRALG